MKKMILITLVILAVSVSSYLYTSIYSEDSINEDPHKHNLNVQTKKYICPMHPQIISDKPGQSCPICGMDLVLAQENSSVEETVDNGEDGVSRRSEIKLSDYRKQLIGLKLYKVEKKSLFKTVKAPGRAAFDPELYTAQAEYQQALRQYERVKDSPLLSVKKNVERMLESSKVRLKILGLSNAQIRDIKPGTDISENLLVYKKGGQVWVYADIFEMDLRNIKKGQSVKLSANYLEGMSIAGVVASTDQIINPKSRTAKVRIKIKKAPVKLRADSYLDVEIFVPQGEHLAIPYDALVDTGEEQFIYVNRGEGRIVPRRITVKFRAGDELAVSDGLIEGDEIVVSGNFLVDSESQLKNVLKAATNSHQH